MIIAAALIASWAVNLAFVAGTLTVCLAVLAKVGKR